MKRVISASGLATLALLYGADAKAQSSPELEQLAERVRLRPTDYDATYDYVRLAAEQQAYDEAISALERLLMFNPKLGRAHMELGLLYVKTGAYPIAVRHLREALKSSDISAAQRAQIEAQLPELEKQTEASRFSGSVQLGLRGQSNAAYIPLGGLYQVGGVQSFSPSGRQADWNSFELAQIAHDYDLQNQRGDVIESRGLIYATQQFALPQYSVALFSASVGPRFALSEISPGLSVKPYVSGAASLVGDLNYVNTASAGLSFRQTFGDRLLLEPGFDWTQLWVNPGGAPGAATAQTFATIASGDVLTGSLSGSLRLLDGVRLEGRTAFSRANASYVASQNSNQVDVQAMLRFEVDPPLPEIPRRWTIAPYARFTQLAFDAPNPLVDFFHARQDDAWTYGLALDAPVDARFGFSGHLEFLRNDSNISSYRLHDVSVTFGPTGKF